MSLRLVSVNVGQPREVSWRGSTVLTSIWKTPVPERRWVTRLNVDGDAQADLAAHGGEHRAVYVYDLSAYRHWERELGRDDFVLGQFGENFTVEGLADDEVRVGDRYRVGGALFEVTQPRVTCFKLGLRMGEPRMPALFYSHGRPGFYLRVLEEGEVGAGDAIERVAAGPMTVRDVSVLLYLPGATPRDLERALAIPALSQGWRGSFEALLAGDSGLAPPSSGPPAWPGLRRLRVAEVVRESRSIASFAFESPDGEPLPPFRPGQYLTVRVQPEGEPRALLRSFSLSAADRYRVSVKREGVVSTYLHEHVAAGDELEVGAPRGLFTLAPGDGPVVLLSAGVGATPVLAMLAQLAAEGSEREVWWIHGARNGAEHTFAAEAAAHLARLPNARSHVCYSRPDPGDHGHDGAGRVTTDALLELGVPLDGDLYLCGPAAWMRELSTDVLATAPPPSGCTSSGSAPCRATTTRRRRTRHRASRGPGPRWRSRRRG